MSKLQLTQPTVFLLYGYPGSGKTYFSRQLCDELHAAHVQGDRIRYELFQEPRYDRQENEIVSHLLDYMAEEFLQAGINVIYDANVMRIAQRRSLREMARRHNAKSVLIWFQLDAESAFSRVVKRDRRKSDDKFAAPMDRTTFDSQISGMQNPDLTEEYIVVSGKRTFHTQRSAILKKLYDLRLLDTQNATANIAKPALVNLIPNTIGGRVDPTRRNITIR